MISRKTHLIGVPYEKSTDIRLKKNMTNELQSRILQASNISQEIYSDRLQAII